MATNDKIAATEVAAVAWAAALEAAAEFFSTHAYFSSGDRTFFERSKIAEGDRNHQAIADKLLEFAASRAVSAVADSVDSYRSQQDREG